MTDRRTQCRPPLAYATIAHELVASRLFDAEFYRSTNPDLYFVSESPLDHYVRIGDREGRRPNPGFNAKYYRRRHMYGRGREENALLHYMRDADFQTTDTSALFRPIDYLALNPELSALPHPLLHWLELGRAAGKRASRLPGAEWADRFDRPHRRALFELMEFKRALVAALGVKAGFAAYREFVSLPHTDVLVERGLRSQRSYARAEDHFYRETHPGGTLCVTEPPPVVGGGDHTVHRAVSRASYLARVAGARVRSGSSLIEVGDTMLFDYEPHELESFTTDFDFDASVFAYEGDRLAVIAPASSSSVPSIPEAFTLLGARTIGFGHWVPEYLLRYAEAVRQGLGADIPVLIDEVMPGSHRRSLEALFPGIECVVVPAFSTLDVGRLWYAPAHFFASIAERRDERFRWEHQSNATPSSVAPALRELQRRADALQDGRPAPQRIYLARRDHRHRRLVNRDEVERILTKRGYEVLYSEDIDFIEQVRMARSARYVVAPQGSAIFLGFFCRPGTKVLALHNRYTDNLVAFGIFFAAIDVELRILTGNSTKIAAGAEEMSDYTIPLDLLSRELEASGL